MKKKPCIIIFLSLFLMLSCKNKTSDSITNAINDSIPTSELSKNAEESNVQKAKDLYDKLFKLIDSNDLGQLPDSQFKPQADLAKLQIDSIQLLLNSTEKQIVKDYGDQLLNDLIQKKATRDN